MVNDVGDFGSVADALDLEIDLRLLLVYRVYEYDGYLARRYGWAAERDTRVLDSSKPRPPQRMLANATDAYVEHYLSVETLALVSGSVTASELQATLDADGVRPRPVNPDPIDYDDFGLGG